MPVPVVTVRLGCNQAIATHSTALDAVFVIGAAPGVTGIQEALAEAARRLPKNPQQRIVLWLPARTSDEDVRAAATLVWERFVVRLLV